jgi:hypothetical protein
MSRKERLLFNILFAVFVATLGIFGHTLFYSKMSIDPLLAPYYAVPLEQIDRLCPGRAGLHFPKRIYVRFEKREPKKSKYQDSETLISGKCTVGLNQVDIVLNKQLWDESSEKTRLTVMTHEVAHCHLDVDHAKDNDYFNYMHPTPLDFDQGELMYQFGQDVSKTCKRRLKAE